MKKSEIVRVMIAEAKSNGAVEPSNELITAVMERCGFHRQLARAYINNNWERAAADGVLPKKARAAKPAATAEVVAEVIDVVHAIPNTTLAEALAKIPQRDSKGHFIKKEVRTAMAMELLVA